MQPIGPLMHEHRLIERMIGVMEKEIASIEAGNAPDARLIDEAVDLFRTYADRCHHGKEEDILFTQLETKPLTGTEKATLAGLIEDHVKGRKMVSEIYELNRAIGRAPSPDQAALLAARIRELAGFYRVHIDREDKDFFFPVMRYFSREEMDAMLAAFATVDGRVFHDKYAAIVSEREKIEPA